MSTGDPETQGVRGVIAGCTAATGIGAALGFLPGYAAVSLQDGLDVSRGAVGLLVSLYFGSTGCCSVLAGSWTHRLGPRRSLVAVMLLVAGCAALGAVLESYVVLAVTALAAGGGYALVNTSTNAVLGAVVAPRRRTTAMSIKTAGVPTMATLAALFAPAAADRWSWTSVWWTVAVVAAAVSGAVWLVLPPDRLQSSHGPDLTRVRSRPPPSFVWFAVAAFLLIAGSQPLFSWLVPYVEERFDTSAGKAGVVAAVATALGTARLVVNGPVADRRGASRRLDQMVTLSLATALGLALVAVGGVFGVGVVAVGATIGIASQLATVGSMHAAIVDRAPAAVAAATGMTMTGYYLGALVSPVGFGVLVDLTGTYRWGWWILFAMMLACAAAWRRADRANPAPLDSA
jgi:CP family cyanate transporter-like MFS transporter